MWTIDLAITRDMPAEQSADLVSSLGGALMITGGAGHPVTKLTYTTRQDPAEASRALMNMLKVTTDELISVTWAPVR